MSNVKPGDLAIVISGPINGTIVNVIQFMLEGQSHGEHHTTVDGWLVEDAGRRNFINACGAALKFGVIPDCWLRPVSGLPDNEHTDKKQPIMVSA